MIAKPFLKWAGGKSQLIDVIVDRMPSNVNTSEFTYIEPFIGGGALFFWVQQNLRPKRSVINDINPDLIGCYRVVQNRVEDLIEVLQAYEARYHAISGDADAKKAMFYEVRNRFNYEESKELERSAQLIFLNKTCFNGLYRVNRKGHFNVPIGSYKKPIICNSDILRAASGALRNTIITNTDYTETLKHAEGVSLFYIDPPYKPVSESSSFNAYAKGGFNDNEQIRLSKFCRALDAKGHNWILSNSDVKTEANPDPFFDDLYSGYEIQRVLASRAINSDKNKRGQLRELLISNS